MLRPRWEVALGGLIAAAAAVFVFVEFQPGLLFRDTTPNGGDTGAHVWWPAYMRDHVFPQFRLSGWSPDWYAGFPVGHFYFPIPALLIVALDLVPWVPYNVAFKLVTVLGSVLLPVAAYSFARGIRAPWPAPPLFAAATLPFLFFNTSIGDYSFHIMGGNLPSTLAGEFSFSLALAVALFALGSLARALDTRQRLWLPALLLALTALTHVIVAVFAAVAAVVLWLVRGPRRTLPVALGVGGVAVLLSAVWTLPMVGRLAYANDMGWGKVTRFQDYLLHPDFRWAVVLAGVALITGAVFLRRATLEIALLVGIFALAFWLVPEGRLWNLRLLPFYQLMLVFLAATGVAELTNLARTFLESPRPARVAAKVHDETGSRPGPAIDEQRDEPGADRRDDGAPDERPGRGEPAGGDGGEGGDRVASRLRAVGTALTAGVAVAGLVVAGSYAHATRGFIPSWIEWNNHGYEAKAAYPEYQAIMDTLSAQAVPDHQRLLWERLNDINLYGSDLALELIPYFTDGKIGSMEGLYFESAATTPYHFITVSEVASEPSNPQRDLPYGNIDEHFDRGVEHLRMLGVRYYLAGSDAAKQKAAEHPGLRFVLEVGQPDVEPHVARWALFEVVDSRVVEPLAYEPVVLEGLEQSGGILPWKWSFMPWHVGLSHGEWLPMASAWFTDPAQFDRPLAGAGAAEWTRWAADDAPAAPRRPIETSVEVTDVELGEDSVRFRVSEPGTPVLVKVSYFPNWEAKGARGPWRVTPNFMVVVPTEEEVELVYGRTPVDRGGVALTLAGVIGLIALARWRLARPGADPTGERVSI